MTDYSVEAQPAAEDIANAAMMLAGDNAEHVTSARALLKRALAKLKGGNVADQPTCPSCGGAVKVSRLVKGRAKGQLSLKCESKDCGARTFVSTKAAVAKFTARYPGLVDAAPVAAAGADASSAAVAPASAGAGAEKKETPAAGRGKKEMPAELVNAPGPEGRRRRAQWERENAGNA